MGPSNVTDLRNWCRRAAADLLLAVLLGLAAAAPCHAHKASDAYLVLGGSVGSASAPTPASTPASAGTRAELSIALKDLDAALPTLDADDSRSLTWGEVRRALPAVIGWVDSGFRLQCGGQPLALPFAFDAIEQRVDGHYVRLAAPLRCPAPAPLVLDYHLFEGIDASHRLLVGGELDGRPIAFTTAPRAGRTLTLRALGGSGGTSAQAPRQGGPATLAQFFPEGVHHILSGIDHLAFLLALLLPIRLFRRRQAHEPSAAGVPPQPSEHGFVALLRTVTAFTVGHSLTLGLASIGWISVPANWVEPAIAITIGVSAALNLYPVRWIRGDVLALLFGLVHGLGFSEVMREAGIHGVLLLWGLAGFNLGVEAGQLLVVLGWCLLQWLLVRLSLYRTTLVRAGSWVLIALAGYWTLQRIG